MNISNQYYAMPNVSTGDGLVGMMTYVNDISDGLFFKGFLLVIYLIAYALTYIKERDNTSAFLIAGFMTMVIAIILAVVGLISATPVYLIIFITALAVFFLRNN